MLVSSCLVRLMFYNLLAGGAIQSTGPKRPNVQMPDEYLPPNKILFLQNLPENVTKDQLTALFTQYVHINLHSIPLLTAPPDIPTFRRYVLFQRKKILLSWNIRTRGVRQQPKMLCTITNWMENQRSRYVALNSSFSWIILTDCRSRSHMPENDRLCWVFQDYLLPTPKLATTYPQGLQCRSQLRFFIGK